MLERYSRSYRLGKTYIDPIEVTFEEQSVLELPRISTEQYQLLSEWYENEGSTDTEPVFKMGGIHFEVFEGSDLPSDTLKVPVEVIPNDLKVPGQGRFLVLTPSAYDLMSKMMDPNINSEKPF